MGKQRRNGCVISRLRRRDSNILHARQQQIAEVKSDPEFMAKDSLSREARPSCGAKPSDIYTFGIKGAVSQHRS